MWVRLISHLSVSKAQSRGPRSRPVGYDCPGQRTITSGLWPALKYRGARAGGRRHGDQDEPAADQDALDTGAYRCTTAPPTGLSRAANPAEPGGIVTPNTGSAQGES